MAKKRGPSIKQQRLELEQRIEENRHEVAQASSDWLKATAPIDNTVARLAAFKVPAMLLGSFLALKLLRRKRPKKIGAKKMLRLFKRSLTLYTLARNTRRLLAKKQS